MAQETETTKLDSTRNSIEALLNYNVTEAIISDDHGKAFDLTQAIIPVERVIALFKPLLTENLGLLPDPKLEQIHKKAEQFRQFLITLENYNPDNAPEGKTPTQRRDSFVQQAEQQYPQAFDTLFPIISFLATQNTNFSQLENQAQRTLKAVQDAASDAKSKMEEKENEAAEILAAIKKIAAEAGVSKEAEHFHNAADEHHKIGDLWLKAMVAASIIVIIVGAAMLWFSYDERFIPAGTPQSIQIALAKLVVIGTLVSILWVCIRNYASNKHNEVVNLHRKHSLLTFQTLVKSATGVGQSDIILTQAAACIYAPQDTGFTKSSNSVNTGGAADSLRLVNLLPKNVTEAS